MTKSISLVVFMVLLCLTPSAVDTAKILAVFGLSVPSHCTFVVSLLNALSEKGHQITLITSFSDHFENKFQSNISKITIKENRPVSDDFLLFSVDPYKKTFYQDLQAILSKALVMVSNIIQNPQVQHILKNGEFDLIMLETFMSEALYGLGQHFRAPMIGVSNVGTIRSVDRLVGNISPLSLIPHVVGQASFDMSLLHRCLNSALNLIDIATQQWIYLPQQRRLYEQFFPNATLTFDKAIRNCSLVLLNQHFSLSYPRPYVPNMIEVAGLHINEEYDALPTSVQTFLDESPQDIIYVNLGACTKSIAFKPQYLLTLFNTFKALNYKVIWNIDYIPPSYKSASLLHITNISHCSILAHPNVKLFITNGEFTSIIEAVFYAKPILGLGIFSDQPMNVELATNYGYARGLKLNHLNEKNLKHNIVELLTNPRYTLKVKEISNRFRDQPLKPMERAIYWIEYVLRHKGAEHLCTKWRYLSFWQHYNMDVIGAFLVGFVIIVLSAWIVLKCLYFLIIKCKQSFKIKEKRN